MKIIMAESLAVPQQQVVDMHTAFQTGEVKNTKLGLAFDDKSSVTANLRTGSAIDFEEQIRWASKSYNISDDARDYAVVPVPIIVTDVPNRNGIAFPAKALAEFSPDLGMPFFKSWKGKPTFEEHDNRDITKAKGIILDSVMNQVANRPGYYKLVVLLAFDRTKDRLCYEKIVSGKSNAYSMGAYSGYYKCSLCGNMHYPGEKAKCSHIVSGKVNFYEVGGRMAYTEVWQPVGFETSRVDTPAYRMAVSDHVNVMDPQLRERK